VAQHGAAQHVVAQHARHNGSNVEESLAKLNKLKTKFKTHVFDDEEREVIVLRLTNISNDLLHNISNLRGTEAELIISMRNRRESSFDNLIEDIISFYNEWSSTTATTVRGGAAIDTLHREYTNN